MSRRDLGPNLLTWSLLALLAAVLLYPIWLTVRGGFESIDGGFTLYHIVQVFADPVLREGLLNAFGIAVCTTLLSLVLSLPLAVLAARYEFPGKGLLGVLILVPLILPPFVGAIGIHQIMGRYGALNTLLVNLGVLDQGIDFIGQGGFWAVVVTEAFHLYPILYLNLVAALANLDPALEEAAENLGASRTRRLFTVVLPLIRPGLFAGATIVFIWSLTELGTPLMFDYDRVTPVQIFLGLNDMAVSRRPYALTAVMLTAAAGAYVLGRMVLRGGGLEVQTRATRAAPTRELKRWRAVGASALFWTVTALAAVPHVGVLLTSVTAVGGWYQSVLPTALTLHHYGEALSHPLAVGSIRNSLFFSSVAAGFDLVLGLMIAYLVVRTRARGRQVLDAMAMLPLAVPGLVMAFGYVAMTLRWPFGPGDPLDGVADVLGAEPNPVPLLIVAYAVRRLPYVVRSAVAGLEQTPKHLEEAALNLGASKLRAIGSIVVPLIAANLVAGGLLAFSFAMLEVSDSLLLAQRAEHFPITKAIYVLFERLGDGRYIASAMGVWAMALLGVTLLGASRLLGRRMGALFRV